jgi:addiction module HigA family antidote
MVFIGGGGAFSSPKAPKLLFFGTGAKPEHLRQGRRIRCAHGREVALALTVEWGSDTVEAAMRMHNPPHPGRIIKEAIEAIPMSVTAFAAHIGVSRVAVSRVLNEKAGVTPEMSIKISEAFGQNSPDIWFNRASCKITKKRALQIQLPRRYFGLFRRQSCYAGSYPHPYFGCKILVFMRLQAGYCCKIVKTKELFAK